jgi:hypothetical protein
MCRFYGGSRTPRSSGVESVLEMYPTVTTSPAPFIPFTMHWRQAEHVGVPMVLQSTGPAIWLLVCLIIRFPPPLVIPINSSSSNPTSLLTEPLGASKVGPLHITPACTRPTTERSAVVNVKCILTEI